MTCVYNLFTFIVLNSEMEAIYHFKFLNNRLRETIKYSDW